ncbi:hypothetical protein V8D89_013509 [Ganoderma adspersum]
MTTTSPRSLSASPRSYRLEPTPAVDSIDRARLRAVEFPARALRYSQEATKPVVKKNACLFERPQLHVRKVPTRAR